MVTPRPGPPPTVAGRSFRVDSSVLDPRARATCRLAPAPRPPRRPHGAVRRPRPGRHAPATLRGVGVPLSDPPPQLADGPLVTVNGDGPLVTVNGAAVSVCVERAGPPATRHTVGRCPGPARRGRGRGLCRHVPGPRPSRLPSPAPPLLPGRGGWPGWRLPPLPLGRADPGAGRTGGDDSAPRQVSVPSQGWVLSGGSELILGPARRAGRVRVPQRPGPCLPRPCSVTFVVMR